MSVGVGSGASTPKAKHASKHVSKHVSAAQRRAHALSTQAATDNAALTPPPGTTLTATMYGSVPGYATPGAASTMTVPNTYYGYPSTLPVIATKPGWLEVRLAQRPNGSTAWVQQSHVSTNVDPYLIVVNLTTMRLSLYMDGIEVLDFPAGIGAPDDPTPPGNFFVFATVPPPSPAYGPFVLATSDHSDTIVDWENSGDALIGIHGPIDAYDDALIGNTGAAISHGCIRLHNSDLSQLSVVPPGTPLDIIG